MKERETTGKTERERAKGLEFADVSPYAVIVIVGGVVRPSETQGLY